MSEKLEKLLWVRLSSCSRIIQKIWRHVLASRLSLKIQTRFRGNSKHISQRVDARSRLNFFKCIGRRELRRFTKMRRCTIKLQSALRRFLARFRFITLRSNCVKVQSIVRMRLARNLCRKIRNSYSSMTYEQLTECIQAKSEALKAFFEAKAFLECEIIQQQIRDLEEFRAKLPVPEKVPTSVAELRLMLLETQYELDHCLNSKDFLKCNELTAKQRKLEEYKSSLCTAEDLRVQRAELTAELEKSMTTKNFKRCAELNSMIEALDARLKDLDELSFIDVYPLPTLQRIESEVSVKMEAAMSSQAFNECEGLQRLLEAVKKEVANRTISGEALELEFRDMRDKFDSLKAEKDFKSMAIFSLRYSDLQWLKAQTAPTEKKDSSKEVSSELASYTYDELTDAILLHSKSLEESVRLKQFGRYLTETNELTIFCF